jgi:protein TonB
MLKISSELYKREWLNLVFKNRNQSYGAYALRAQSGSNTVRALFIAVPLFVLLFASPKIYSFFEGDSPSDINLTYDRVIELERAPIMEIPKPQKDVETPKAEPLKEKVKMVKLPSNPVVVATPADMEPPTIQEVENAVVGPATQDGEATKLSAVPVEGNGGGIGLGSEAGNGDGNAIHDVSNVEIYPEFEGGAKAWAKFLQRHLRYPLQAMEEGRQGKVFVSFIVEKDGSVSHVQLIKGSGYGMDEEAIRVISKSPKWKPGRQNNANVRVRFTMPISFALNQ